MINTNKLFHTLYQKTRLMSKVLNEHLQEHHLYGSQWTILYCLKINGPMTQTDIWRYLSVEAPTVTRTLVKLEESGWVKRTQGNDKRERLVTLTEKAIKNLGEVEEKVKAFEQSMVQFLTVEEQENLYSLLCKLGTTGNSQEELIQ